MRKVPRAIQTMSGLSVSRLDGSKSASAGTTGGEGVGNLWKTASAMPHLQSLSRTHGRVLEPEDRAPVAFHVDHSPATGSGFVERSVELAHVRLPVVGPFALGIGVVHEPGEARAAAIHGPLQHLQVAVGVAEGEDRTPPDETVDADRLARPVIDELDLGLLPEHGLAIRPQLVLGHAGRADHLLGWNAVDPLDPWPHELDAT